MSFLSSSTVSSTASEDLNSLRSILGAHGDMQELFHSVRVKTFMDNNWPWVDPTINRCTPDELSMAGLVCVPGDQLSVRCFVCNAQINNLRRDSNPWDTHKRKSPNCLFIGMGRRRHPRDYTLEEITKMYLLKTVTEITERIGEQGKFHEKGIVFQTKVEEEESPEM